MPLDISTLLKDPVIGGFVVNLASSIAWDGAKKSYSAITSRFFPSSSASREATLEAEFTSLAANDQIRRQAQHFIVAVEKLEEGGRTIDQFSCDLAAEQLAATLSGQSSECQALSRRVAEALSSRGIRELPSEHDISRLTAIVLVAITQSELLPLVQLRTTEMAVEGIARVEKRADVSDAKLNEIHIAVLGISTELNRASGQRANNAATTTSNAEAVTESSLSLPSDNLDWDSTRTVPVGSARDTDVLSRSAATRTINLLDQETARLEQELRNELDSSTERLWDEILVEIRCHNFRVAIEKGKVLKEWIQANKHKLSGAIRGRALLLLGHIALTNASELGEGTGDFRPARESLDLAREAFGTELSQDNLARLNSFEAKLLAIEGKVAEGLSLLDGRTDPQSIMTSLLIHIDEDTTMAAIELIRSCLPDEKWADLAVYVFSRNEYVEDSENVMSWAIARNDPILVRRCQLMRAQGILTLIADRHRDSSLSPFTLAGDDRELVRQASLVLSQPLGLLQAQGTIHSGLDAAVITYAYTCLRLLGHVDDARRAIALAADYRPVILEYAQAVSRRDVAPPQFLPEHLREDYPRHFQAHYLALAIEIEARAQVPDILSRIQAMSSTAHSDEQREVVARLVVKAIAADPQLNAEQGLAALHSLVSDDHWLVRLMQAITLMRASEFDRAEGVLEALNHDDTLIGQFIVQIKIRQGKSIEASELLESLGRRMTDPDLLIEAAHCAASSTPKRLDIAVRALTAALAIEPGSVDALRQLAYYYVQLQGFTEAAKCFRALSSIEPTNVLHRLHLARSLVLANHPQDGLVVLNAICTGGDAPIEAHVWRALLLCNTGHPGQALAELDKVRDSKWSAPPFVMAYMHAAHAANHDRKAHEAFEQLWKLQQEGIAPEGTLQPKKLQDLIDLGKDYHDKRTLLHKEVIAGKLPWLFVDSLVGHVPHAGWRSRTQRMSWIFDDAETRASFAVYASNGFVALGGNPKQHRLEKIRCCDSNTTVVADLSALLTLHRLGLLQQSLEFFGRIQIPPSYLTEVVEHSGRLRPHQLSQKVNLEAVRLAIDRGEIEVLTSEAGDRALVDEYNDDADSSSYRIRDLLDVIYSAGYLTEEQLTAAHNVAHCPARELLEGVPLSSSSQIVVALQTLLTLANQSLVDTVNAAFGGLGISSNDYKRLQRDLCAFADGDTTQSWHDELWQTLGSDSRVKSDILLNRPVADDRDAEPDSLDSDDNRDEVPATQISAIAAMLLAQQEKLPLLADDRVCQNSVLHAVGLGGSGSFGSDAVIIALLDRGLIDLRDATSAFLQLLKWRYRFLVMPVPMLVALTNRAWFAEVERRQVALYVHDCMRDAGLFAGREATNPPTTIALSIYHEWSRNLVEFAVDIWFTEGITDAKAAELTVWAIQECLPSPPANLGPGAFKLAELCSTSIMQWALLRLLSTNDYAKANRILRTIADAAGLSDDAYQQVIADIVNSDHN